MLIGLKSVAVDGIVCGATRGLERGRSVGEMNFVIIFTNFRCIPSWGIRLLTIAYRMLSSVMCYRLKPFANKLIGSYQCSFRPDKSTIEQTFTPRQILEKERSKQIDTFHLSFDFESVFETPDKYHLYAFLRS